MLELSCRKAFTLNVGNFLKLKTSFHRHIIVLTTTDIKGTASFRQQVTNLTFDQFLLRKGRLDRLSYDRQLMNQIKLLGFFVAIGITNRLCQES